jgi:hypothetical protein
MRVRNVIASSGCGVGRPANGVPELSSNSGAGYSLRWPRLRFGGDFATGLTGVGGGYGLHGRGYGVGYAYSWWRGVRWYNGCLE